MEPTKNKGKKEPKQSIFSDFFMNIKRNWYIRKEIKSLKKLAIKENLLSNISRARYERLFADYKFIELKLSLNENKEESKPQDKKNKFVKKNDNQPKK